MPRFRTVALATLVCFVSLGLAAGLAWRWLLREALLVNAGRQPTLREILRPRGTELRAALWGIAFMPVTWGGVITFLSPAPFAPFDSGTETITLIVPWVVAAMLCATMRGMYWLAAVPSGEAEAVPADPGAAEVDRRAWARHVKVALWCGAPGLVLCMAAIATKNDFALFAIPCVFPALLAPLIGALSALPVLARGLRPCAPEAEPSPPSSWPRRTLFGGAAIGLAVLWLEVGRGLLVPPLHPPLLGSEDFVREDVCGYGAAPELDDLDASPPEVLRTRLADAGVPCAQTDRMGDLRIDDQWLAWCAPGAPLQTARFFAIEEDSEQLVASRQLSLHSDQMIPTPRGVVAATSDPDGSLRIVRIGRSAAVDAEWLAPKSGAWSTLWRVRSGVLVAWTFGGNRLAVVELGDDLAPRARPIVVEGGTTRVGWVSGDADHLCVSVFGPHDGTLVLDRDGRVWRPRAVDRLLGRLGTILHLGWTAALFVLLGFGTVRAWRARRTFARNAARGAVCEGDLVITESPFAHLHRPDGRIVRVRTDDAARFGFDHDEIVDGPCVLVGVRTGAAGAAYRDAPSEIDGASCVGIVRGDLAHARASAVSRQHQVLEAAVVVGWLVAGPVLALLLLL